MTVYVDYYPDWLGVPAKWIGGGHLFTDNLEELHRFARRLGLKRAWYQHKGFPHYDLTEGKRLQAIRLGATEVEPGVIPEGVIRRDPDQRPPSG